MTQAAKDDVNKPVTTLGGVISAEQQLVIVTGLFTSSLAAWVMMPPGGPVASKSFAQALM